jgi:RNA polymerase sigma-70 factor (ECF subfamily)
VPKEREEVVFRDRERDYVFSVAMKYVRDEDEAADVAQDALLLAYRHRHTFRGDSRFSTWLYRIAATTALMHLRKKRRMPRDFVPMTTDDGAERTLDAAIADLQAPGPSPEEALAAQEAVSLAGEHLEQLGEKYGDVFVMRFRDGYSEAEIAKKLRLNVATVKTRAYRARAALRAELTAALGA